jgi:redox-sensitive bicupin YhaK (pirin superfamily)
LVDKWESEGVRVKVIAGEAFDIKGPIYARTPAEYMDFEMKKNSVYKHTIPEKWNFMVYCFEGSFEITQEDGSKKIGTDTAAFMEINDADESFEIKALENNSRFMLISGLPLRESISQHGPFVMNTDQEISDTISDYHGSDNGFEGADVWESEIKNLMKQ